LIGESLDRSYIAGLAITISPEREGRIQRVVASGRYATLALAMEAAIQQLEVDDPLASWSKAELEALMMKASGPWKTNRLQRRKKRALDAHNCDLSCAVSNYRLATAAYRDLHRGSSGFVIPEGNLRLSLASAKTTADSLGE
jgi:hypothetical protein